MSSVSSMEPVGITKACTNVVVPNSNRRMVMVHSAIVPLGGSCFTAGLDGDVAAGKDGSVVAAAFPRSVVGFITSIPLVYQQAAGHHPICGGAKLRQAKYRY